MADPRSSLALAGERLAEKLLRQKGMRTLGRRYSTPVGELDLVMRDADTIVFVEVKTQRDARWQAPQERVTRAKQARLIRAAKWFLIRKRLTAATCRFDVFAVILPESGAAEHAHFENAFTPRSW
jgi:putative endonuclease